MQVLMSNFSFADFRRFSGVGNSACEHPRTQRLQVCRHVRLQCGHHVRHGSSGELRAVGQAGGIVRHHLCLYFVLHNGYLMPSLRAKGMLLKGSHNI